MSAQCEYDQPVRADPVSRRRSRSRSPIGRSNNSSSATHRSPGATGDDEEHSRIHQRRRLTGPSHSDAFVGFNNENSTSEIFFDQPGTTASVGALPPFMGMSSANAFSMAEHSSSSLSGALPLDGASAQGQSSMAGSSATHEDFMRKSLQNFSDEVSKSFSSTSRFAAVSPSLGISNAGSSDPRPLKTHTPSPADASTSSPSVSSPMQMAGDEHSRSSVASSGECEGDECDPNEHHREELRHASDKMDDDSDNDDFLNDPHLSYPSFDDKDCGGLDAGLAADGAVPSRCNTAAPVSADTASGSGDEGDAEASATMPVAAAATPSKPFPCQYCVKGFKYLRGLNRHMNQVSGV